MNKPQFILASQSFTRIKILKNAGLQFLAYPALIKENELHKNIAKDLPSKQAIELATAKARSLSSKFPDQFIIGSDQILSCENNVYHKVKNAQEAASQLKNLRGKTHELHTAVTVIKNNKIIFKDTQIAVMTMHNFSDDYLNSYLEAAGEEIISSVGCYHFEGLGIQLFDKVDGDYFAILGMPLLPILKFFRTYSVVN
jgi:septum formation protein